MFRVTLKQLQRKQSSNKMNPYFKSTTVIKIWLLNYVFDNQKFSTFPVMQLTRTLKVIWGWGSTKYVQADFA